jgi:3-oxoadipate enol-lactonase
MMPASIDPAGLFQSVDAAAEIAGALDEATPPSQSEELQAAISGSMLVVLPEASHLSNVEQPATFNGQLVRFLAVH